MASSKLQIPKTEIIVDSPNRASAMQDVLSHTTSDSILGRGTYGTVIKAIYKGKEVAVKILDNRTKPKMLTIKSEANILGWKHKNIIEIYKVDLSESYSVVIMERFPGQCLQSVLDCIAIPVCHRILISLDISSALEHCHKHDLIHSDVKPQNVLVAYPTLRKQFHWQIKYICKLCDFGSSIKINNVDQIENHTTGTVRYMPPEALKRNKITTAVDVYSLGITMWQIKSGKYPYAFIDSNESVAYQVVKDNLRPTCKEYSKFILTPTRSHENCLCEYFSSDQSVENSVIDLKKLGAGPVFQRKERRVLFKNISNKMNSPRQQIIRSEASKGHLNPNVASSVKSLTPQKNSSDVAVQFFENNKELLGNVKVNNVDDIGLKNVFETPNLIHKEHLKYADEKFEDLYTTCWNDDPERRPVISAVKLELLNILLKLS